MLDLRFQTPLPRRLIGSGGRRKLALLFSLTLLAGVLGAVPIGKADASAAPVIIQQPEIAIVTEAGKVATFTAVATGSPTPAVQWQWATTRDGAWQDLPGYTASTITITSSPANLGNAYRAVFTNTSGTAISRPAKLVSRPDWMGDLGSDIGDVPITELTLPGTHDTGTYAVSGNGDISRDHQGEFCETDISSDNICQSYAQAQTTSKNMTAELNDGIRYFDLRVCGDGHLHQSPFPPDFLSLSDYPVTCHELKAASLDEILSEAATWADRHPKEVIMLDLNHHYQVNVDYEASLIEQAFTRADGTQMMLPPEYCNKNDASKGTCAGNLTLNIIHARGNANVIVNFENDPAGNQTRCFPGDSDPTYNYCDQQYNGQAPVMESFYYFHPLLWGLTPKLIQMDHCTVGGAVASCFGNDTDRFTILKDLRNPTTGFITTRQTFAEPNAQPAGFQHFFVGFMQTTPDTGFVAGNTDRSLLDMAISSDIGSNRVVGPEILGCGDWNIYDCYAQYLPENLNILAENFYDRVVDSQGQPFDFVYEVIRFNEYARTAPVVTVAPATQPAATGWYNAASLGGQGKSLQVNVTADAYRWPTGINAINCSHTGPAAGYTFPVASTVPTGDGFGTTTESAIFGEGVHTLDCNATDGAAKGLHGVGHNGAGPGSTRSGTFKIDTVPPVIGCPTGSNAELVLNQPVSSLVGAVSDSGSGVASSTANAAVSTSQVGTFTSTITASDLAGNTATATCSYTVSYKINLDYDSTRVSESGSAIAIKVQLVDYFGTNVSSPQTTLTASTVRNVQTGGSWPPMSPGKSNPTGAFDNKGTEYEYYVKTTGLPAGQYSLEFVVSGDPLAHRAPFWLH